MHKKSNSSIFLCSDFEKNRLQEDKHVFKNLKDENEIRYKNLKHIFF